MLRLRPFKPNEAEKLVAWFSDESSFRKWGKNNFDYPLTVSAFNEFFNKNQEDEFAWQIAALDEDGNLVGHFQMRCTNYNSESVHLGYIVIDPEMRGKGYGKEMIRCALNYAFEILKMKKVTVNVYDSNPAAHGCYLSVGFHDEEFVENALSFGNETWGVYKMAVVKNK